MVLATNALCAVVGAALTSKEDASHFLAKLAPFVPWDHVFIKDGKDAGWSGGGA